MTHRYGVKVNVNMTYNIIVFSDNLYEKLYVLYKDIFILYTFFFLVFLDID